MAALLLRGGGGARTSLTRRSSSPSSMYRFFSPSSKMSSSPTVVSATATADVTNVVEEEDLIDAASPWFSNMPTLLQPRVVVYDGVCHLCHSGVKMVIKADKYMKIKFCCLQSKTAEPYMKYCGVNKEDVLRRFLFVEGPGSYYQGSTAALKVMWYLPMPYSALSSLAIIPLPLREAIYDYVAKRRYDWFGKDKRCLVLKEKEMLERFIDRGEIMGQDEAES